MAQHRVDSLHPQSFHGPFEYPLIAAGSTTAFTAVELVGVDQVVPDAVEAAGDGGDGGEEGVAHPDGQHGVFLAERLAGGDGVAVVAPYSAAEVELAGAACERYGHEPELGGECYGGMDDASRGHGHGKGEGYGPEVERQVLMAADARAQLG